MLGWYECNLMAKCLLYTHRGGRHSQNSEIGTSAKGDAIMVSFDDRQHCLPSFILFAKSSSTSQPCASRHYMKAYGVSSLTLRHYRRGQEMEVLNNILSVKSLLRPCKSLTFLSEAQQMALWPCKLLDQPSHS